VGGGEGAGAGEQRGDQKGAECGHAKTSSAGCKSRANGRGAFQGQGLASAFRTGRPGASPLPRGAFQVAAWLEAFQRASRNTTFVRRDRAKGLASLAPCGRSYLVQAHCQEDAQVVEDIARSKGLVSDDFARFLRVAHAVECGDPSRIAELPSAAEAGGYADARAFVVARHALLTQKPAVAVETLSGSLMAGDPLAFSLLAPALMEGAVPWTRARELVQGAVDTLDEQASPFQRALLAAICTQTRDAQCVRHHGLGAAVMGEKLSRVALGWLVEHHESAAVRDDARRWARLLAE